MQAVDGLSLPRRCQRTSRIASILLSLVWLWTIPATGNAQDGAGDLCFTETKHCISGRIRQEWEGNGGNMVFGYPLGPQREEVNGGLKRQTQWFERARLELNRDKGPPDDVVRGQLGLERLQMENRDWTTFPSGEPSDGCMYFDDTHHNLCEPFLSFWQNRGLPSAPDDQSDVSSTAVFGRPVSEAGTEQIGGQAVVVQWFERARFELRDPAGSVELGQVGSELYPLQPPSFVASGNSTTPRATVGPSGSTTPTPPPGNAATPTPTATLNPAAIRVPMPIVVVGPSTPQPAAPTAAGLNITNNSGGIARITLSGPTSGTWPLDDKQTFQPPISPGAYVATVTTMCGAAAQSFTIDAGTTRDFPLSCEDIKTVSVVRVINSTGGLMRFSLTGPFGYDWFIASGQTYEQKVIPGDYSATLTTACGSKTASFSVQANATQTVAFDCPAGTIRIRNQTPGIARIDISGPTASSLSLAAGDSRDLIVQPGQYRIAGASSCGAPQTTDITVSDGRIVDTALICLPTPTPMPATATPTLLPTGAFSVTNNASDTLSVSVSGPIDDSWGVPGGGQTVVRRLPVGNYHVSLQTSLCGSETDVSIIAGEQGFSFKCVPASS